MVYDIGDWTLKFRNFENLRWRQPPYWKNQKIAISQQWLDRFLQNLAQWCRMGSLTVSAVNILNFKNSRWWTAVMLRTVKLWYLHKHLDEFDKIWHDNAYWLPIAYWLLKLGSIEIPRWWRPSHWKVKNSISLQQLDHSLRNLAPWYRRSHMRPICLKIWISTIQDGSGQQLQNGKVAMYLSNWCTTVNKNWYGDGDWVP